MDVSPGFSVRGRLLTVALACLLPASLACAETQEPEKPEKQESSAIAEPTGPAAATQPIEELERRVVEVENRLAPLRKAVEDDPGDPDKRLALGHALIQAHFQEEALEHFEIAVELDPDIRRLLDLGLAYSYAARLQEAEETYRSVLAVAPNMPIVLHNLGNLAHRRGDYDEAIGLFRRALEQQPGYLLAQAHLADSLRAADRPVDAYRAYEQVLSMEPANPREAGEIVDALYQLAALDLMMGAHERAKTFLEEVVRLQPDHGKAYYAYGQVLLHLGQPEQAQQAFAKHAELLAAREPNSAAAMGE